MTREATNTRRVLTYVALGVGGAGLVAGGITGSFFLRKRSDLKDECPDPHSCPPSSREKIDTYNMFGTVSGVSLAVGVAGVGAGLALLFTEPKPAQKASAALRVRPLLGLGIVGAEGSFQ